jgi:hypothetical protein
MLRRRWAKRWFRYAAGFRHGADGFRYAARSGGYSTHGQAGG